MEETSLLTLHPSTYEEIPNYFRNAMLIRGLLSDKHCDLHRLAYKYILHNADSSQSGPKDIAKTEMT
jgi:hypothetical protein